MKSLILPLIFAIGFNCSALASTIDVENQRTVKVANQYCLANLECKDLVSMELDGMYYQGKNEKYQASVGGLITKKLKEFKNYCVGSSDEKVCESYKNQLILKYITGLLER